MREARNLFEHPERDLSVGQMVGLSSSALSATG
jgi:hypothetical protein